MRSVQLPNPDFNRDFPFNPEYLRTRIKTRLDVHGQPESEQQKTQVLHLCDMVPDERNLLGGTRK